MTTIFLSAGDASGDLHGSALVDALRARLPGARFVGLGGVEMEKVGVQLVVPQRELAIGGLVEVLSSAPRVWRAWRSVTRCLDRQRPDLLVLLDSLDFNLPLARRSRRRGLRILYYIAPQVWAWRRGRIRTLARCVDRMAVIFPFEAAVFAGSGVRVDYVGHPLVERMQAVHTGLDRKRARSNLGLDPDAPLVVLLPGSRRNELRFGLTLQLASARALHAQRRDVQYAVAVAPTLAASEVEAALRAAVLPPDLRIQIVENRTYQALRAADAALAKPGTITVEAALLGCPLVVAARASPVSAFVVRRIVRVPSFTMVNLIAGAPVIPEFLQEKADPERIARALASLLQGPARELQLARLARVRDRLGAGGAAQRVAAIAQEMVHEGARP